MIQRSLIWSLVYLLSVTFLSDFTIETTLYLIPADLLGARFTRHTNALEVDHI